MLADLELAEKRLGSEPNGSNGQGGAVAEHGPAEAPPEETDQQPAVMVIEPSTRMQDIFREGLKKVGYRVLLTGDPLRAVQRLRKEPQLVGCVLFNAEELGQSALSAFNQLADEQETQSLPAVLLLRNHQRSWMAQARTSDHRVVLFMPLTMRQLRETLGKLIPTAQTAKSGG
jgi:CheY-like chemotaxis protein